MYSCISCVYSCSWVWLDMNKQRCEVCAEAFAAWLVLCPTPMFLPEPPPEPSFCTTAAVSPLCHCLYINNRSQLMLLRCLMSGQHVSLRSWIT